MVAAASAPWIALAASVCRLWTVCTPALASASANTTAAAGYVRSTKEPAPASALLTAPASASETTMAADSSARMLGRERTPAACPTARGCAWAPTMAAEHPARLARVRTAPVPRAAWAGAPETTTAATSPAQPTIPPIAASPTVREPHTAATMVATGSASRRRSGSTPVP